MTDTILPFSIFLLPWVVALVYYSWYETFSFSINNNKRRYQYQIRFREGDDFLTQGSGFFYAPTLTAVQMIPEYGNQPNRRILDSYTGEILYELKTD